jgi:hypothetical protein
MGDPLGTVRLPAELPVSVRWQGHGQPQCEGKGVTRNLNSRRMFVLAHKLNLSTA